MKLHIRLFLISLALIVVAVVVVKLIDFTPSEAVVAQSEATAYIITFVGVILSFRWFKIHATPVDVGQDIPANNLVCQKKVMYILLVINALNALVLVFSQKESVQMMLGISLIVLLISPHVFRTMQEKDTIVKECDPNDNKAE